MLEKIAVGLNERETASACVIKNESNGNFELSPK